MRWILCGKSTPGSRVLEFLSERGDEVWAVGIAGDDGRDGWQRSFRATAERLGLRFDQPRRINAPAFIDRLAEFDANALISIQYDQILRGRLLRGLGCPCLNLHFALLPRHRGVQPIAWAILSDDTEAGVTLHHMVEDIDAGDVISQRSVPIDPAGTARELYDALCEACFDLFRESYPFESEFLATRLAQDPANASYHRAGDFDFSRRRVDWSRAADELHAWLRAMIFPPFQYPETQWRGELLRIERVGAKLGTAPKGAEPGRVVAAGDGGLAVVAGERTIQITQITQIAGPGDLASSAPFSWSRVAVGDRLA